MLTHNKFSFRILKTNGSANTGTPLLVQDWRFKLYLRYIRYRELLAVW